MSPPAQVPPRAWLSAAETNVLLQPGAPSIDKLLRAGLLRDVSVDRRLRLDPDSVVALVAKRVEAGELGPLALHVARLVVAGDLSVPTADPDDGPPRVLDLLVSKTRVRRDAFPPGR